MWVIDGYILESTEMQYNYCVLLFLPSKQSNFVVLLKWKQTGFISMKYV